jgi:hypothetical protein
MAAAAPQESIEYHLKQFDPHFEQPGEYMGPPNPHLDKLWYDLSMSEFHLDLKTPCRLALTSSSQSDISRRTMQLWKPPTRRVALSNTLGQTSIRSDWRSSINCIAW